MGLTALSKIQARAFTEDSREDILLNAVSEFVRLLIFHNMISKQIGKVPLGGGVPSIPHPVNFLHKYPVKQKQVKISDKQKIC